MYKLPLPEEYGFELACLGVCWYDYTENYEWIFTQYLPDVGLITGNN